MEDWTGNGGESFGHWIVLRYPELQTLEQAGLRIIQKRCEFATGSPSFHHRMDACLERCDIVIGARNKGISAINSIFKGDEVDYLSPEHGMHDLGHWSILLTPISQPLGSPTFDKQSSAPTILLVQYSVFQVPWNCYLRCPSGLVAQQIQFRTMHQFGYSHASALFSTSGERRPRRDMLVLQEIKGEWLVFAGTEDVGP